MRIKARELTLIQNAVVILNSKLLTLFNFHRFSPYYSFSVPVSSPGPHITHSCFVSLSSCYLRHLFILEKKIKSVGNGNVRMQDKCRDIQMICFPLFLFSFLFIFLSKQNLKISLVFI